MPREYQCSDLFSSPSFVAVKDFVVERLADSEVAAKTRVAQQETIPTGSSGAVSEVVSPNG